MKLHPEAEKALEGWLGDVTWHTSHPSDMNRWFEFVNVYQRHHGFTIDEAQLQELIEVKGAVADDWLKEVISDRITLAYYILDFLQHTKR